MCNPNQPIETEFVDKIGSLDSECSRVPVPQVRRTWCLWLVRAVTLSYFLFMLLMLLHPDPWSLFGLKHPPEILNGLFSVMHFLIFVVLAFGVECGRLTWSRWRWLIVLLIVGPSIEWLQIHTGRAFEWIDVVENVSGILCGTLLGALFCMIPIFRRLLGKNIVR